MLWVCFLGVVLSALVVEEVSDLLGYSGHDGGVEKGVETREEQRADDNGNEDLDAGVDVAFCLLGFEGGLCLDSEGVDAILNLGEHVFVPYLTFLFCV